MTPEGQNFWDNFAEHLEKFKEDCKNLSADSLVRLTEDPSSKFMAFAHFIRHEIQFDIGVQFTVKKKKTVDPPSTESEMISQNVTRIFKYLFYVFYCFNNDCIS